MLEDMAIYVPLTILITNSNKHVTHFNSFHCWHLVKQFGIENTHKYEFFESFEYILHMVFNL